MIQVGKLSFFLTLRAKMDYTFSMLVQTRQNILSIVNKYDLEQLNKIPTGFRNNLAWNFGHVLVTQQLLCYRLSGLDCYIEDAWIDFFRKGSQPDNTVGKEDWSYLKTQFIEQAELLKSDYEAGKFIGYKQYPTSYGMELSNIEEAIQFNNVHEAMHLGTMITMTKLI
jgi:hypothetical protein